MGAAVDDPVGEHFAGTAGRLNADGVEAAREEQALQLGRLAEQVTIVGRERLGAVEEQLDAGLL